MKHSGSGQVYSSDAALACKGGKPDAESAAVVLQRGKRAGGLARLLCAFLPDPQVHMEHMGQRSNIHFTIPGAECQGIYLHWQGHFLISIATDLGL